MAEATTNADMDIDIVNVLQATAGRFDSQQLVNDHLIAIINTKKGKRRLTGDDFNAANSSHGYTTIARFQKSTSISRT